MTGRLVLRIEREGRLLGSWSLGDAPLDMTMVDVSTGRVIARFSASAEALAMVDGPRAGGPVDEVPVPVVRLDGDDFTMPLPEPTDRALGELATEERARDYTPRPRNLAGLDWGDGDGLTNDLHSVDEGLDADEDALDERTGLTRDLVPLDDPDISADQVEEQDSDGVGLTRDLEPLDPEEGSLDELPVPGGEAAEPGLTAELRTATVDMPATQRHALDADRVPVEDQHSLTARTPRAALRRRASDQAASPAARPPLSAPPASRRPPQPAEVWTQKRGEWRSLGHLVPGQRVSTLGGWIRLAPDGRLVVHSGGSLAGSATLLDGRMIEIDQGQDFVALPPGSSVMLAVGDRGIYVRSEPLPEDEPAVRLH